jgi:hypothetical protein
MHRPVLTAAILAAALVADAQGAHSLSFYLVLAAIPALAWTALANFAELVEGRAADDTGALNVGLSALALGLVVLGAGVRAHALAGEVPALGTSAVVGALALLGLQLAIAVATRFSRERVVEAVRAARARA